MSTQVPFNPADDGVSPIYPDPIAHPDLHAGQRAPVWGDETEAITAAFAWAQSRIVRASDPKATAPSTQALTAAAGPTITESGIGATQAMRVFTQVIEPATRAQDDPMNLAYIPSAPTGAAVAFDVVTAAATIFAGMWEAGAGAIWAENQTISWLTDLLGWPADTAAGTFVSGGTSGNLAALVAARAAAEHRLGRRPDGGWQLACSSAAHSSITSAARVMDVAVLPVPQDDNGRLTGAALRAASPDPDRVFAVVASAGTTNAGLIDDLAGIADVCQELGTWMHVDGADSFIVDPHKWLFAGYDCCALVYRDTTMARAAHAQHASYLDAIDREHPNPSDLAVQLSRRARGLPLWFSLATHGTAKYAEAIDITIATAQQVAQGIREIPYLHLIMEPDLTVLSFERVGWTDQEYRAWSNDLAKAGVMLCAPTSWRGRTALRLAFVNPATRSDKVIEVLRVTTAPQRYAPRQ